MGEEVRHVIVDRELAGRDMDLDLALTLLPALGPEKRSASHVLALLVAAGLSVTFTIFSSDRQID